MSITEQNIQEIHELSERLANCQNHLDNRLGDLQDAENHSESKGWDEVTELIQYRIEEVVGDAADMVDSATKVEARITELLRMLREAQKVVMNYETEHDLYY